MPVKHVSFGKTIQIHSLIFSLFPLFSLPVSYAANINGSVILKYLSFMTMMDRTANKCFKLYFNLETLVLSEQQSGFRKGYCTVVYIGYRLKNRDDIVKAMDHGEVTLCCTH